MENGTIPLPENKLVILSALQRRRKKQVKKMNSLTARRFFLAHRCNTHATMDGTSVSPMAETASENASSMK
jgi:hypothetical protein